MYIYILAGTKQYSNNVDKRRILEKKNHTEAKAGTMARAFLYPPMVFFRLLSLSHSLQNFLSLLLELEQQNIDADYRSIKLRETIHFDFSEIHSVFRRIQIQRMAFSSYTIRLYHVSNIYI